MSKKVLIVDDEEFWQDYWRKELGEKVVMVSARTIKEAEEQFAANPDIVAIVMDACVPGDRPNTPPLVRKFRETFSGPMIAISSSWNNRDELVEAGCDHTSAKNPLPRKLLEVLGEEPLQGIEGIRLPDGEIRIAITDPELIARLLALSHPVLPEEPEEKKKE